MKMIGVEQTIYIFISLGVVAGILFLAAGLRCTNEIRVRWACCALLLIGIASSYPQNAEAQQPDDLELRKVDLEVQKLELEIAGLRDDGALPTWFIGIGGLVVGILGTAASPLVARRTRLGAFDQSVHDARLKSYPRLVAATAPLALYFPKGTPPTPIDADVCRKIGRAMSRWYFVSGGILLSTEARDAYFRLARALTLASSAQTMCVPVFSENAVEISKEKIDDYREELGIGKGRSTRRLRKKGEKNDDVETWVFGTSSSQNEAPWHKFKDFVFLQTLSSSLRTALSKDLRSRRRPS